MDETQRAGHGVGTGPGASRRALLRRGGLAAVAAAAGASAGGLAVVRAASSPDRDREVLELLLLVERAERALYRQAAGAVARRGELRGYVDVVLGHERAHVEAIEAALATGLPEEPDYAFGVALTDREVFTDTAARLEDIAVAAYNGQAGNVSAPVLATAARIVSVEARHAGWIRAIAGRPPAPDATDRPATAADVRQQLRDIGVGA
jgi:hypothetical protein